MTIYNSLVDYKLGEYPGDHGSPSLWDITNISQHRLADEKIRGSNSFDEFESVVLAWTQWPRAPGEAVP